MRVIAGKYGSRRLQALRGLELRPTSDRLRETLFDVLTAGNPSVLDRTVWLDLFAGTGAVGIEALSRGAAMVHFVESSAPAAALIAQNLRSLKIESGFEILRQDASRTLAQLEAKGVVFDFVFMDPPYQRPEIYRDVLERLSKSGLLKPDGLAIVEHQKKFDPGETFETLHRHRRLVQGDSALSFYRRL
jgi:16S rRNA (guanine966-N2)-methyltransferase